MAISPPFSTRHPSRAGLSLVDLLIGSAILAMVSLMVAQGVISNMQLSLVLRKKTEGAELCQSVAHRFMNMDYYDVFSIDSNDKHPSNSPFDYENYKMDWSVPRVAAALVALENQVRAAQFSGFTVQVIYQRRDLTDSMHAGQTSERANFTDEDGDKVDDFDPTVKFQDLNGDGKYYDVVGGVSEAPNTRLKFVTLTLLDQKRNTAVRQSFLVTHNQFQTEDASKTPEADLPLILEPWNHAAGQWFIQRTGSLGASLDLPITKDFNASCPSCNPTVIRADLETSPSPSLVNINVETVPNALIHLSLDSPSGPWVDFHAPGNGLAWPGQSVPLTTVLIGKEGTASLWAYAESAGKRSGNYFELNRYYIDKNPPSLVSAFPISATVHTLTPYLGAIVTDTPLTAGNVVAGVRTQNTSLLLNGSTTPITQTWQGNNVVVVGKNATSKFPVILNDGVSYNAKIEFADEARYKSTSTWSFAVDIDPSDGTVPTTAIVSPLPNTSGTRITRANAARVRVNLNDLESGPNPYATQLRSAYNGGALTLIYSSSTVTNPGNSWKGDLEQFDFTKAIAGSGNATIEYRLTYANWAGGSNVLIWTVYLK